MTSVKDKTDKLVEYIDEAKKVGITVLPPDINESLVDFAVVGEPHSRLRFGRHQGRWRRRRPQHHRSRANATDKFTDIFDLAKRVDAKQVNRRVFEALTKCGALDELPGNRAQKLAALDVALDLAAHATREAEMGQFSLFGDAAEHAPALVPTLPNVPEPSNRELLAWEKETLGIFVSGHPLSDVQTMLVSSGATLIKDLRNIDDEGFVQIAGMVTSVRRMLTKNGQQILIAQLEDTTGSTEVVVFAKLYGVVQQLFVDEAILVIKGRLRLRERPGSTPGEEPPIELSVNANEVTAFERPARWNAPPPPPPRAWHVELNSRDQIDRLAVLLDEWPGEIPVVMHARGRTQTLSAYRCCRPSPARGTRARLRAWKRSRRGASVSLEAVLTLLRRRARLPGIRRVGWDAPLGLRESVAKILADVRAGGDAALVEHARALRIPIPMLEGARTLVPPENRRRAAATPKTG